MGFWKRNKNPQNLRVIKTARDLQSINKAIKEGLKPIIRKVKPSSEIQSKYALAKNNKTGEIEIITDMRDTINNSFRLNCELLIDWTFYYPHNFKSPFAAYLIPEGIILNEQVFLEDLIEDYVGASWNQGDTFRLDSCEAIWNGSELEIQYSPDKNMSNFVG